MTASARGQGPRLDPVNIGCNALFALLLMIPAVAILLLLAVVLASVPLVVAVFPITLSVGGVALGLLYWRHRRARRSTPDGA